MKRNTHWRSICGDTAGLATVEWVGLVGVAVALLVATMLVLQSRGVAIAAAATETLTQFIAALGGSVAATNQPGSPVGALANTASTSIAVARPTLGTPLALIGQNNLPDKPVLAGLTALAATGTVALSFRALAAHGAPHTRAAASTTATERAPRRVLSGLVSGYYGSLYGELVPRLLVTARTYLRQQMVFFRGFIHEDLWQTFHNANPIKLLRQGWARIDSVRNTAGWDGWIRGFGRTIRVQLKSIDPAIITLRQTVAKYARMAARFTVNQRLLVTREVADDVIRATTAAGRVASSGVSTAEAVAFGTLARRAVAGSRSAFARLVTRLGLHGARRAGIVGAILTAGFSVWENVSGYMAGQIDKQTAVSQVTVDVVGGAIATAGGAFAGAWAGAAAGAAVGTVVPGVGNVCGCGSRLRRRSCGWLWDSDCLGQVCENADSNCADAPDQVDLALDAAKGTRR